MKKLKLFIQYFVSITTGILLISAVSFALMDVQTLPKDTLWQVLLSGFLTAVATTFLFPIDNIGKKSAALRMLLHFVCLCIIMVFCGMQFGWIHPDFASAVHMVIDVALVYAFTFGVNYFLEAQQAALLTKALLEKYSEDNA